MVGRDQRDLDGLGDREEARGPDRFEPDQRIGVGGQLLERVERLGNAVAPDAQDPRGGGPGVEVGRGEHPVEQLDVDDVLVLVGPEGFGQADAHNRGRPCRAWRPRSSRAATTCAGVPRAQLGPGPVADAVLGVLEQIEQLLDRGAGDPGRASRAAGLRR